MAHVKFTGTVEERLARLDHAHRRCDGNGLRCVFAASLAFELLSAKAGTPIPDAEPVRKQSCTRHKRQFTDSENYVVVATRKLVNRRDPDAAHPHTIY